MTLLNSETNFFLVTLFSAEGMDIQISPAFCRAIKNKMMRHPAKRDFWQSHHFVAAAFFASKESGEKIFVSFN